MLLALSRSYESTWFSVGFAAGVVFLIIFCCLLTAYVKWEEERAQFKEWKKQQKPQTPEVVDAQFVNTKPRPTYSPQLNSPTSLVRRTGVERRKI